MPIELPDLDDKTYAELVEEARASIPGFHPGWTDHNPSDPGIALVELLAWLTEMLIYRTGQLPERNQLTFLSLLNGGPYPANPGAGLGELTRSTMRTLRERWRAVTSEDYEYLAMNQWPGSPEAQGLPKAPSAEAVAPGLARARCFAERDLSGSDVGTPQPGHMSLIVVPAVGAPWALNPKLASALQDFFRERRVVSTHFHVSSPTYVPVSISATLCLRDDANARDVRANAPGVLARYFDPRLGGRGGDGWPFGREVPASEVYATLDQVPGVEFVESVTLQVDTALESRKLKAEDGATVLAIRLQPHELPRVELNSIQLTLKERDGGKGTWEVIQWK